MHTFSKARYSEMDVSEKAISGIDKVNVIHYRNFAKRGGCFILIAVPKKVTD